MAASANCSCRVRYVVSEEGVSIASRTIESKEGTFADRFDFFDESRAKSNTQPTTQAMMTPIWIMTPGEEDLAEAGRVPVAGGVDFVAEATAGAGDIGVPSP